MKHRALWGLKSRCIDIQNMFDLVADDACGAGH